jgi:hypothetical protein
VNGANLAYITGCQGEILAGKVTCASGNSFEIADAGQSVCTVVAECYNDWLSGLADNIVATNAITGWLTDPLHSVTIRPAAGQGHRGVIKDAKGNYSGFALKGTLDVTGLPYARVSGVIVDPGSALAVGPGASLSRVLAGEVRLGGNSMAANVAGSSLSAAMAAGSCNWPLSFYNWIHLNEYHRLGPPVNSRVSFYNCTATTFDPGDQAEVEFINCLAATGGKGFIDNQYTDGAYANHCVSADGTAIRWDSGDGSEGNVINQTATLVNAAAGDYHLQATDKAARGRGAPGLGPDIDGEERTGPQHDVGADAGGRAGSGK